MKTILVIAGALVAATAVCFLAGWLVGEANPTIEEPAHKRMHENDTTAAPLEHFVLADPFPKRRAVCARCRDPSHHVSYCPEGDES